MNDPEIETLIQHAEKQVGSDSLISARFMGGAMVLPTPFFFLTHTPVSGIGAFYAVCCFVIGCLWADGKKLKRSLMKDRARTLWQQLDRMETFDARSSLRHREMINDIGRIYERDPRGEIFPIHQAIRLVIAWSQQYKRLHAIHKHLIHVGVTRATLLEKQKLLRELNDENAGIERALARLDTEIAPLECSYNALRASCARLEALVVEVDATTRRRQLHREVGELTAHLPLTQSSGSFELSTEHLDIERQISREIETFLQLERETDAQLRDL